MGTISDKLTYLNGTKQALKESINNLGGSITPETTFREYAEELDTIYSNLPKVTGEGTEVILTPTLKGKLGIVEKGNSTQESTNGYQLLDTSKMKEVTDVTAVQWYDLEGNVLNNATLITSDTLTYEMQGGQEYTFTLYEWANIDTVQVLTVSNNNWGTLIKSFTGTGSHTFTASATTNLYVRIRTINGNTKTYAKCMLEKGSTPHTYEQYTGGIPAPNPNYSFPIKNVTGNNNVVVINQLFNATLEQGTISADNGATSSSTTRLRTQDFIEVEPNTTYYIKCSDETNFYDRFFYYQENNTFISASSTFNVWAGSFTTPNNCTKLKVIFRNSANTTIQTTDITGIKLYKDSQTLPLNLGNIELNKIGNYQDYIYKNNDKWYKKEVIGKVVLNGTEASTSFTINSNLSTTDYTCFFYGNNLIAKAENDTTISAMSDKFKGTASNQRTTNITNCWLNHLVAGQLGFHIQNTITTVNDLKTWLVSNNTTFYYLLATSTDIEITDTNLINQLENIDKVQGYNGTTIITSTFDSSNAQMIISVSGLKGE